MFIKSVFINGPKVIGKGSFIKTCFKRTRNIGSITLTVGKFSCGNVLNQCCSSPFSLPDQNNRQRWDGVHSTTDLQFLFVKKVGQSETAEVTQKCDQNVILSFLAQFVISRKI